MPLDLQLFPKEYNATFQILGYTPGLQGEHTLQCGGTLTWTVELMKVESLEDDNTYYSIVLFGLALVSFIVFFFSLGRMPECLYWLGFIVAGVLSSVATYLPWMMSSLMDCETGAH